MTCYLIPGTLGVVLSIIWLCTIYETPEQHPRLSEKERRVYEEEGANMQKASAVKVSDLWIHAKWVFLFECFMLCACSFILKGKEHSVEGYIYVTSCLGITAGQCNKVLGFCHNGYGDTPMFCWRLCAQCCDGNLLVLD